MEHSAYGESQTRKSSARSFVQTHTLDCPPFANPSVSHSKHNVVHPDPQPMLPSGGAPNVPQSAALHSTSQHLPFSHNSSSPVSTTMAHSKHNVSPHFNKGERQILPARSIPAHHMDRPALVSIGHHPIPQMMNRRLVMAPTIPPHPSSSPIESRALHDFDQVAKSVQPDASRHVRTSTSLPEQSHPTHSCWSSGLSQQIAYNERMHISWHAPQLYTTPTQQLIQNPSVFHPQPSFTMIPNHHYMHNSYPATGASFTNSRPYNHLPRTTAEMPLAPKKRSCSSGTGNTALVAKPVLPTTQRAQTHAQVDMSLPHDGHMYPTSTGTQVLSMNPVSTVFRVPASMPRPLHAQVPSYPFTQQVPCRGNSAPILTSIPVPDFQKQNATNRDVTCNMGQSITSNPPHPKCALAKTNLVIGTASRTPTQRSNIHPCDEVEVVVKQCSQRSRKRTRTCNPHLQTVQHETENSVMHKKSTVQQTVHDVRETSRFCSNKKGNTSEPCHGNFTAESVSPTNEIGPGALVLESSKGRSDRSRRRRCHNASGIDELDKRTCPVHRKSGVTRTASLIRSEQPESPPLRSLEHRNLTKEARVIPLSPCDEDIQEREKGIIARHSRHVGAHALCELGHEADEPRKVFINLRVKPPANAYSPVSDETQAPLTPPSSGDHSSDALAVRERGKEPTENNCYPPKSVSRHTSFPGKQQFKSRRGLRIGRSTTALARKGMSTGKGSIPLRLRIVKPKSKAMRRAHVPKRTASKRAVVSKHTRKRQSSDGVMRRVVENRPAGDLLKKPSRLLAKPRPSPDGQVGPRRLSIGDSEGSVKKLTPLLVQKIEKSNGKTAELQLRKSRWTEVPACIPVPIHESCDNLSRIANAFETELRKVRREGCLKSGDASLHRLQGARGSKAHFLRCSLCADSVPRSTAVIHPRFPARNFFLCSSCHKLVDSRTKAVVPVYCETISDAREAVLRRTTLFVMVVENIVQAFPPTERESRGISGVHSCISSRVPLQLQQRAKFIKLPFQIVALLRVVLRKLGITIQKSRLRWRMQPIKLPRKQDIVEIIHQAIPQSLDDLLTGATPSQRVWDTVFPNFKLENCRSAYDIVSKLLALVGVRVHHLCKGCVNRCAGEECCLVQFDLLSVCAVMHRAFLMVSGTLTEKLFKVWNSHMAGRVLQITDTRLAHGTLVGKLPHTCSICALRKHPEKHPFRFHSCVNCDREICSLCLSNVMGPSELAFACTGDYKCLLCRVDQSVHERLLRSGGQIENLLKPKITNGAVGQGTSKMKPQLPMLHLCSSMRKRLLSSADDEISVSTVGFSKFCEEANEHTCRAGPSSTDAHMSSFAFPTRDTGVFNSCSDDVEWCFGCKRPIEMTSSEDLRDGRTDDEEPTVLRCVSDNCGVVMHRDCSPAERGRRRRAGRPKWSCPRHRCQKCAYRDDSRLFKCRTCPLALCKDHMHKPCEVYLYSERLFACTHCMKKLNPPRPCLVDKLPKRKNEFTQALNAPQAKRRRIAELGSSSGLGKPYPGCLE